MKKEISVTRGLYLKYQMIKSKLKAMTESVVLITKLVELQRSARAVETDNKAEQELLELILEG